MNRENQDLSELRQELERLRITANNIERIINDTQVESVVQTNQDRRPRGYRHSHPAMYDSEGIEILIGDHVQFVTRGLFTSTRGVVYKISPSGNRVTARDNLRRSISRAPHNLRVIILEQ